MRTWLIKKRKELAKAIGVTDSMIGQIERGTKAMTVSLGNEIAQVLNCDLNYFVS